MKHGARRRWSAAAAALAGLLAAAGSASSAPGPPPRPAAIAWSTYLRAGPGETYTAISELEHDTQVRLVGCSGRWCQVSAASGSGYVDRDALDLPRTLAPRPPANADCVVVSQADNRGPIPTRFCSAMPGGR